ncbi:hypothetical protein [Microbacterium jiangjiandongii]|uniref:hypothetical protein n=1 Tax=Microbacterium jiangjiandongii TaxID=3049071 RepID=UPI00214B83B4|nr:hypothetical protein [Microbacterium sp. zg.Y843]MCR2814464.1 hypothetical protein [Microbacterium sp. zg.Y843]
MADITRADGTHTASIPPAALTPADPPRSSRTAPLADPSRGESTGMTATAGQVDR